MLTLEGLSESVKQIQPHLVKAGLREFEAVCILDKRVDVERVSKEIQSITDKELAAWLHVRAKVTESMWDFYEATDERRLIECVQLRKASHELRTAWRKRVVPFFKEMMKREGKAERKKPAEGAV